MIVVTDTSVVLNLCWLRQESLLSAIYEDVLAPGQVRLEFERKATADPRFTGLAFPGFITLAEPASIPAVLMANSNLDHGEIAALALALERGIADVLIDEKAGRAAALALGLHVSGLLGVLIEGKHRHLVPSLRPLLDTLAVGARFWIDARLRERVLRNAGETPLTELTPAPFVSACKVSLPKLTDANAAARGMKCSKHAVAKRPQFDRRLSSFVLESVTAPEDRLTLA